MSTKKKREETDEEQLDRIIEPDKNLLDDEWIFQPRLFRHWAKKYENAKAEVDDTERYFNVAKSEFELAKAEIDLEIRSHPENYEELPKEAVEKGKVTEKMVAAVLVMQRGYKDAQEEFFGFQKAIDVAKHKAGILQAVVKSLDQRKTALENLVDLHGQKYFATPRASEDSREAMEEVEKNSVRRRGQKKRKGKPDDDS